MSRRIVALAVATTAALTAGCNAGNGEISGAAERVLRPAVEAVRQSAATGSYSELRQAVAQLNRLVQQEESAGDLSADRATAIEDAAGVLLENARPTPSPTPSPTATTPTPTPTTESPTPTVTPTPTPTSPSPISSPTVTPLVSVSALANPPPTP